MKELLKKTLYEIVTTEKEVANFLYAKNIIREDEQMIKTIGKKLTLALALQSKRINPLAFLEELKANISSDRFDVTLKNRKEETKAIKVKGVLPCPVRMQMLEKIDEFSHTHDCSDISIELQAASMGLDWLTDSILQAENPDQIADMYLSAGFELFFNKDLIGKFVEQGIFEDYMPHERYHQDFDNKEISLKDPKGIYSVLGVVPAVFMVNTEELNGRELPSSWSDILSPEWAGSVSIPVGDFDLFNSILLSIYKLFGEDGIKRLAQCFHQSMHPSEMVLSNRKANKPAISIIPYFFSKMARPPMSIVWPKEGAVVSPIFMLSKKDKKEQLKDLVALFAGREIGEILSHQGRFPSTNPQVDNELGEDQKFIWLGWDFIYKEDIHTLIKECGEKFHQYSVASINVKPQR